jgi:hypothetical protein
MSTGDFFSVVSGSGEPLTSSKCYAFDYLFSIRNSVVFSVMSKQNKHFPDIT